MLSGWSSRATESSNHSASTYSIGIVDLHSHASNTNFTSMSSVRLVAYQLYSRGKAACAGKGMRKYCYSKKRSRIQSHGERLVSTSFEEISNSRAMGEDEIVGTSQA